IANRDVTGVQTCALPILNDGWISVEEPPEDGQTVLCTDGEYVYLVEYDADLDAPFGDMDGITHWQPRPEPYRPASGTDKPDWRRSEEGRGRQACGSRGAL